MTRSVERLKSRQWYYIFRVRVASRWKERKAKETQLKSGNGVKWTWVMMDYDSFVYARRLHEETAASRFLRLSSASVRVDWDEREHPR